jgi:carbonic anhydrase
VEREMSLIDDAIKANEAFAKTCDSAMGKPPAPKLVIVTCMEPQMSNLDLILGLRAGDADIIRNAGSVINEDSMRSLLISTRVLGTREIMIINHTECGMTTFHDNDLVEKLEGNTGLVPIAPARFYAFSDVEANTRLQIQKVKTHQWIPRNIPVRGFIYDVHTGKMREVTQPNMTAVTKSEK